VFVGFSNFVGGGVFEWFKEYVLKVCVGVILLWV